MGPDKKRKILTKEIKELAGIDLKKESVLEKAFAGNLASLELLEDAVLTGLDKSQPIEAIVAQDFLLDCYKEVIRGAVITNNREVLVYINNRKGKEKLEYLCKAPTEFSNQEYVNHSFFLWD